MCGFDLGDRGADVNLRRAQGSMAEDALDVGDAGAVGDQVGGTGVTPQVRRHVARNSSQPPVPADHDRDGLTGERLVRRA